MTRIIQDLSGRQWQMERMRVGQGEKEQFHLLPAELQGTYYSWNFATVPGDVYTDLQIAGEIDDPYYGRNMQRCRWVQEYEWWYIRRFNVDEAMEGKKVQLQFEGVDYSCKVWLNGYELGEHEGMFSPFSFDVTDALNYEQWNGGSNLLVIRLDPPPRNYRLVGGKKMSFSGDYLSGLVPFGIWRPVKLIATEQVRIQHYRTEYELNGPDAQVHIEMEVENMTSESQSVQLHLELEGHNFSSEPYSLDLEAAVQPGIQTVKSVVNVENAELWWPWDMGKQNLYDLTLRITQGSKEMDVVKDRIGIRVVHMEMNPGFTPEECENPWTFMINGKRHYLRSACWGGQPSFLYGRNRYKKYEKLLNMVKECNINNLRIFGWHPPEIPDFYRLCDELGITVWTNFALATQVFPEDKEFVEGVAQECVEVVKGRRNHPSNIFWMGGEEVFFTEGHFRSKNKQLLEYVGEVIAKHTSIPYNVASPLSHDVGIRQGFKPKESKHANGHYYTGGRKFMEEFYPAIDCAIIPELTAASAPSVESLKKFIPPNELWPMGPSWGYHWADIDFLKGLNIEVFGDMRMGSLEQFVEATQIAHGTILQYALEVYRRRKPRVSGVSFCHFITHWPDIKWGIVDYYGEKKLCFDYVKRTYNPLLASLEFSKRRWKSGEVFKAGLWIVNDYHFGYDDVKYKWLIKDGQGQTKLEGDFLVNIIPDSSIKHQEITWTIDDDVQDTFVIELQLVEQDETILSSNEYTLLIADQDEAKKRIIEHLDESEERRQLHGRNNYYRYHPELWELE